MIFSLSREKFLFYLEKTLFFLGTIGFIFLPISISISQFLLYFSTLILLFFFVSQNINIFKQYDFLHVLIPIASLGIIWGLSFLYHSNFSLEKIQRSEIKEIFLILPFFWSYYFFQKKSYHKILLKVLFLVILIYILIGLISLFIPFRLSNLFYHLQHGFFFSGQKRFQHLSFPLNFSHLSWKLEGIKYPIGIYMPVGFSGTHLSFGAQIAIITLFLFNYILFNIFEFFFLKRSEMKKEFFLTLLFIFLSSIVLFFSQARSAIFGFFITAILILYSFLINLKKFNFIDKRIIIKFIFLILLFFLLITIASLFIQDFRQFLLHVLGIEKKNTDYQRMIIWYISIKLFLKNILLGVGPGNFEKEVFLEILEILKERSQLWYEMYQTEIMHAHNDLLHILAISGIVGGVFFITFFYLQFKNIDFFLKENAMSYKNLIHNTITFKNTKVFLLLPVFLLFAGIFQCYFLEDRTMLFFWFLYGASLSEKNLNSPKERGIYVQ